VSHQRKFSLGRILATPGALEALDAAGHTPVEFLHRHVRGDWGEVNAHDRDANDLGIRHGLRVLSAYRTKLGARVWVITEADRRVTTLLLPEEY
jgi:hypothetical protein